MSEPNANDSAASQRATLMSLIYGFMPARIVYIAAELGLADLLADGDKTAAALAEATQTDAASLHRLMRALATLGVVEEVAPSRFALTALGGQLRAGVPGSLRNVALMFGGERAWSSWGDLLHSIRTGQSATQHVYGMSSFEYLAAHPEQAAIFNEAMAEITRGIAQAVVAACDFSAFRRIADLGGGTGTLIAAILAANPGLHGILFDLPSGSEKAPTVLEAAGVAERCRIVHGDFFHSVPEADAYILKNVIHDWDDEQSRVIFRNCRAALSGAGRLLLVERIMPARMEASIAHRQLAMMDMNMLVMPGGRERSEAEYRALLAAADFRLARIVPTASGASLIEAIPV
jgi:hypothetical protein